MMNKATKMVNDVTLLIDELWGVLCPDMSPEVWRDAVLKLATDCHVDVRKTPGLTLLWSSATRKAMADRAFTPVPKPLSKVKPRGRKR